MSTDSQIEADLRALADSSARGLPTLDDTARAVTDLRAKRSGGTIMSLIRKPMLVTAAAVAAVAAVLVCPVPYTRNAGYELTVSRDGRVAKVRVPTHDAAQAERRAAALRRSGAAVTVAARSERVWGSVYAMAKDKLVHIHVDLDGKSDEEVASEVRAQLADSGWTADDVQLRHNDEGSTLEISGSDGQGRQIKLLRKAEGGKELKMDVEVGGIDDSREPGMTDAQLRDKILGQLKARGLDGDVQVDGGKIMIRANREQTAGE